MVSNGCQEKKYNISQAVFYLRIHNYNYFFRYLFLGVYLENTLKLIYFSLNATSFKTKISSVPATSLSGVAGLDRTSLTTS